MTNVKLGTDDASFQLSDHNAESDGHAGDKAHQAGKPEPGDIVLRDVSEYFEHG
jgi:hypothetical protein